MSNFQKFLVVCLAVLSCFVAAPKAAKAEQDIVPARLSPLINRRENESDESYSRRYQGYFRNHRKYLGRLYKALKDDKAKFPLLDETIPGYARILKPAGTPTGQFLLPHVLLTTHAGDYTVTGNLGSKGLTLRVKLNKGSIAVTLVGCSGCAVRVRSPGAQSFDWVVVKEDEQYVLPRDAADPAGRRHVKEGDYVEIFVPREILQKNFQPPKAAEPEKEKK